MIFNCGDVLLPCLQSMDGKVDEIHCFDSRWMPAQTPHSIDDTKSVIEEFSRSSKSKAEYHELPSPTGEGKARTLSIENVTEGDWIFVLDSDERVVSWGNDIRSTLEQTKEFGYYFFMDKSILGVCRLFRKINGMKYRYCNIHAPDGKILQETYRTIGIIIHHDYDARNRQPRASEHIQGPHP